MGYDDSLDAFGIHGVAGIFGALALVFFIRESWMHEAAAGAGGSWSVVQQLVVQIKAVAATIIYSVVVSGILIVLVDKTVGFRLPEEREKSGMDHALHGEHGYGLTSLVTTSLSMSLSKRSYVPPSMARVASVMVKYLLLN